MTPDRAALAAFVDGLAAMPPLSDTFNPYANGDNPYNAARRANLRRYLEQMAAYQPAVMLISEAPSYRGMRVTGVPAGNRLLRDGVPQFDLFGLANGYQPVEEPGFNFPAHNQTASAIWGTLAELGQVALVWNACPFHPHLPGNPLSNRTPRTGEIKAGIPYLREMLTLFPPQQVIAVGNIADRALTLMGVEHTKIRHPAQGGKNQFVSGLRAALTHDGA